MRRLFALIIVAGLFGNLGCCCGWTHHTCDCEAPICGPCCPKDICSSCCNEPYHYKGPLAPGHAPSAVPMPSRDLPPEEIKAAPAPKVGATDTEEGPITSEE